MVLTLELMVEVLRGLGYQSDIYVPDDADHSKHVWFRANGYTARVLFYERTISGVSNHSYQFNFTLTLQYGVNVHEVRRVLSRVMYDRRFVRYSCIDDGKLDFVEMTADFPARLNDYENCFRIDADLFISNMEFFCGSLLPLSVFQGSEAKKYHSDGVKLASQEKPDYEGAASAYAWGAVRGFAGSQNNLGDMYEQGRGVAQSLVAAMFWYARAAERGEPTAYLSLQTLLWELKISPFMTVHAAAFGILAEEQLPDGHNKRTATTVLEEIRLELTREQFREAERLAEEWRPLYQERALLSDTPKPDVEPEISIKKMLN